GHRELEHRVLRRIRDGLDARPHAAVETMLERASAFVLLVVHEETRDLATHRAVVGRREVRRRAGAAAVLDAAEAVPAGRVVVARDLAQLPALARPVLDVAVSVREVALRDQHEAVTRVTEAGL